MISGASLDDFFEVLRWSKQFGVNTDRERMVRGDVRGLFAAKVFNPKEQVHINGETISLAAYAERRKIQILKASDLNDRLSKRG